MHFQVLLMTWTTLRQRGKAVQVFFQLETSQVKSKVVSSVCNSAGDNVSTPENVSAVYRDFFCNLFAEEPMEVQQQSPFLDSLSLRLCEDQRDDLDGPLQLSELDAALRSMANGKTPGGDGLTKEFYVAFWDMVGPDLAWGLSSRFQSGRLVRVPTFGTCDFIGQGGDPLDPQNRRPISLLNVDYKILAKSLCLCLGQVLPDFKFQICGVRGRSIHDNIRLLRDLVEFVDGRNLDCLVISLDQRKAFDCVN